MTDTITASIAADATASLAERVSASVSQAIAQNPMAATVIGGALGLSAAGALVYFGGRMAVDAVSDAAGACRDWVLGDPDAQPVPAGAKPKANPSNPPTIDGTAEPA